MTDRDEIAEQYAWGEGEREALSRDTSARAAAIAKADMLEWCRQRNATREARMAANYPMDAAGNPLRGRAVDKGSPMTDEWAAYIKAQLDARDTALLGGIADVLHDDQTALRTAESEIAALKLEVAELRGELRGRLGAETERQVVPAPVPWPIKVAG